MVYLAEHPALAVLEVRVHLELPLELMPDDYVLMRVTLPEPMENVESLPDGSVDVGDTWLRAAASPVLRVPSALVPHAWNLLLNPRHPLAAQARIGEETAFTFDPRLWRP